MLGDLHPRGKMGSIQLEPEPHPGLMGRTRLGGHRAQPSVVGNVLPKPWSHKASCYTENTALRTHSHAEEQLRSISMYVAIFKGGFCGLPRNSICPAPALVDIPPDSLCLV